MVVLPVDLALVYDLAGGWRYETAPSYAWLEEQEALLAADDRPRAGLSLVPPLPARMTACRPGSGPCRRRHEHASQRRIAG